MIPENAKYIFDTASVATAVATLAAWLPPIAALISLVWGLLRIYETRTVQSWLNKRNMVQPGGWADRFNCAFASSCPRRVLPTEDEKAELEQEKMCKGCTK